MLIRLEELVENNEMLQVEDDAELLELVKNDIAELEEKANKLEINRICGRVDHYSVCLVFGLLVFRCPVSTIPSCIPDRYKERPDANVLNNAGASGK